VPPRSRALANSPRGLAPLVLAGVGVVLLGAAADLAFHLLAPALPSALSALLGRGGVHAHLLTLVGMVVTVLGLVGQARSVASP
jgi:hypothetical protein